jgi:hypothetical protein
MPADPGRTGPHDPRRQSDLALGPEPVDDKRLRTQLCVILDTDEAMHAIGRAMETGWKREAPNDRWTDHEKREAVRHYVADLIKRDMMKL